MALGDEDDVPGRMPRHVKHAEAQCAQLQNVALGELALRSRWLLEWKAVDGSLHGATIEQRPIGRMHVHGHVPNALDTGNGADVIDVRVR